MTLLSIGDPVTASSSEAVVGLHLSVTREREVEHDLLVIARSLVRLGVAVTWLSTHRTVTDAGASCSAALVALTDADLLVGYLHVVERDLAEMIGQFTTGPSSGSSPRPSSGSDEGDRAAAAATARAARSEGRAVWFPGHDTLGEQTTVGDLLAHTAIEQVTVLGARTVDPATVVLTRNFVRPRFVDGRLVLHAQPARGGVLVPFETPNPTPCCADH